MRFTLDQLATFDCIARLGSFAAAARHLNLTQPTISQRIRELELALGKTLFLRQGSGAQLTLSGEMLLESARGMLTGAQHIAGLFANPPPLNGNLRFGTTDTFAQICLVEMIARIEAIYPGINLAVSVDNSTTITRMLVDGQIDLAIVVHSEMDDDIVCTPLGYNEMAWVCGGALRLPQGPIGAPELARHHIVLSAPPSRLHQKVLSWMAEAGSVPARVSTCNNLAVIVDMVAKGLALGVLPTSAVGQDLSSGRIRRLDVHPALPSNPVTLIHRRGNDSPGLEEVARIVRDLVTDHQLFLEAE